MNSTTYNKIITTIGYFTAHYCFVNYFCLYVDKRLLAAKLK